MLSKVIWNWRFILFCYCFFKHTMTKKEPTDPLKQQFVTVSRPSTAKHLPAAAIALSLSWSTCYRVWSWSQNIAFHSLFHPAFSLEKWNLLVWHSMTWATCPGVRRSKILIFSPPPSACWPNVFFLVSTFFVASISSLACFNTLFYYIFFFLTIG